MPGFSLVASSRSYSLPCSWKPRPDQNRRKNDDLPPRLPGLPSTPLGPGSTACNTPNQARRNQLPVNNHPSEDHVHPPVQDNSIIIPIGTIEESTGSATTISLIPPHPSTDKLQPQATILTRNHDTGAHARAVVRVVEIQDNAAHFAVLELETEPAWPEGADPSPSGCPCIWACRIPSSRTPHAQGTEAEIEAYLGETHGQGYCPAELLQEAREGI